MNKPILSIQNVVKRFPGTIALRGVSFDLYSHEVIALAGENGAGKSTLMKILSGSYPKSEYEGEVVLNDHPCSFANNKDAEEAGIAMIYQELNPELDLTVTENIVLGKYPRNRWGMVDWNRADEDARAVLDQVGLDIDRKLTLRNLSPSMQQQVSIARALYRNPKVLILDEPTSVLTEKETEDLFLIIERLKKQGISCIYISHKLDEMFRLCDRIVVLRDGRKISEHSREDGYNSSVIIEDMIGRHLDAMYPERLPSIGEEVLRAEHFKVPHPFAYGKNIIEDVSFSLKKGEILGLAGLVGAGRSELLSAVFGAMAKTEGRLFIDSKEVSIDSPQKAIRQGIGFLSEDRKKNGYIWSMNIGQNMTLAAIRSFVSGFFIEEKKEKKSALEYFEKLSIKAQGLSQMITSLSGGNQQKVILAKWLMTDINILMLDEPTRGIDVGTKAEIYKLMQQLTESGMSIIMISSEMPELLAMCDRIIVLGKGVVQAEYMAGEADEVKLLQAASCT